MNCKSNSQMKNIIFFRLASRITLFIFFLTTIFNDIIATNIFPGHVSGTWSTEGNPYYVLGNISVNTGDTLNIKPGVIIYFTGNYSLNIYGDLFAIGTKDSLITFSSGNKPIPGDWNSILFYNSGSEDILKYAVIQGATNGLRVETHPTINNGRVAPTIENCIFNDNVNGVFVFGNADCECFNSIEVYAEPKISNCTFRSNDIGINIYGRADASYHYPKLYSHANPVISNCIFKNNNQAIYCAASTSRQWNQQGVYAYATPIISNNIFYNGNYGINLYAASNASGHLGTIDANINSNVFDSCLVGVYANTSGNTTTVKPTIDNNIFNNCTKGIQIINGSNVAIAFENNNFWNNLNNCQGCVTLLGRKSLVNANKDSCDIFFNIFENPNFVNRDSLDYHLTASSHCIDAGTSDTSGFKIPKYDLDGRLRVWDGNKDGISTIDIGCLEFEAPLCIDTNKDEFVTICSGENYYGWTESGTYERELISQFGCDSIIKTHLIVNELPYFTFTFRTDTLTSIDTFVSYQWKNENGIIEGATSNQYIIDKSGTYYLEVTDENGCTSVSGGMDLIKTGFIELASEQFNLIVIPNPNEGKFTLRFENGKLGDYQIQIINELGQVQFKKKVNLTLKIYEEKFELNYLPKGNYFVKVSSSEFLNTSKIVIQ